MILQKEVKYGCMCAYLYHTQKACPVCFFIDIVCPVCYYFINCYEIFYRKYKGGTAMSYSAEVIDYKGKEAIELTAGKYKAVVAPFLESFHRS